MNYANMKIYFDGGHYVGIPQGAFPSGKGCKRRAVKPMKQQSTADVTPSETPKERFETAYKESQSLPKRERKAHISRFKRRVCRQSRIKRFCRETHRANEHQRH